MPTTMPFSTNRAFERVLRLPSRANVKAIDGFRESDRYQILMEVVIEHEFYNASGFRCPDFRAKPTPTTAAFLRKLGLLFRNSGSGFYVLYDKRKEPQLLDYLQRETRPDVWPRLSFVLWTENHFFVGISEIPIDTDPLKANFYFSNRMAHSEGKAGAIVLNPRRYVRGNQLVPVIGTQYQVPVDKTVDRVIVRDIANAVVNSQPRCVPLAYARTVSPESISSQGLADFLALNPGAGNPTCRDLIYLNFANLPEDQYTIEAVDQKGQPVQPVKTVLYTSNAPVPLCFIDLLYSKPTGIASGRKSGIYPVSGLFSKSPKVIPTTYALRFQNRRSTWNYFIVPQDGIWSLGNLRIENLPTQSVIFLGPCPVRLGNGQAAYRFTSKQTIPLQENSEFHFQLLNASEKRDEEKILCRRLPVASPKQVFPLISTAACRRLQGSLQQSGVSDPACRILIDHLCRVPEPGSRSTVNSETEPVPDVKTYSDVFVYV